MTDQYLGEIRPLAFNFAPQYWAQCNGQLLPINQYQALFSLLGTYYGGNGTNNFALPDLRGRVPFAQSGSYTIGQAGGTETVTLNQTTIPQHNHLFVGTTSSGNDLTPTNSGFLLGTVYNVHGSSADNFYVAAGGLTPLNPGSVGPVGNSQPHTNIQPYLAINWCIALQGIYPSRN